ncbi:MAG: polysaccharide pyruvyl transferase family protein [Clostridia bacterium]|nr:polysaccharide pyruvyl transferase family protein [Clostridia bacterium]
MKVGILSMQRVNNYGSFFQALSLKSILEEMGNTVEFIDIKPGKVYIGTEFHDRGEKDWNNQEFIDFRNNRNNIISNYAKKYLNLSEENNYNNDYDFAIIGSDEVFNCIGNGNIGFTTQLFGEDVSNHTITYAACCGHTNYEQIEKNNLKRQIQMAMNKLKSISVRDKNTLEFVEKISNRRAIENVDPVFIYDFDKYMESKEIFNKKDYIIIYSYDYRLCNEREVEQIKKFAKKKNLKTVGLGLYQPWCDENINVTPFELLEYFKNANYVITDTFHGAVFSIKYNKQFVGISRTSNKYKFNDLLSRFCVNSQNLYDIEKLEDIIQNKIDYDKVNRIIEKETKKSIKYITEELTKAEEEKGSKK